MLLPSWLTEHHLLEGSRLGIIGGVVVGYPLSALAMSLVHRACHEFHPLWLMGHQVHHSPRRLDIPGSAVFHPLDMALLSRGHVAVSRREREMTSRLAFVCQAIGIEITAPAKVSLAALNAVLKDLEHARATTHFCRLQKVS